jgi:3alpha(or 20beta)-hydroxysteroid dehydrogenase
MSRFEDRVVLITGGARGLGLEEGTRFAAEGAHVVLTDVLPGTAAVHEICAGGGDASFFQLDVSSESDWKAVVEDVGRRFGRLDVLVNNAGVTTRVGIMKTSPADWERILRINLTGPFLGIKAVAPLISRSGGGSIVNIGSIAGLAGHFTGAYAASKWGLRGLSHSAARELASSNIRVNMVHPGIVISPIVSGDEQFINVMSAMTPLGRPGSVSDIAGVVLFLASDEAGYITGQEVIVDGGFTTGGAYNRVVSDWPEYEGGVR